uniref:Uncharacterized protein n=1 Tax=uncultured Thiotrichaceae bacterium TaxID=298394 RepID=A0A6S6UGG1_9GAMM|nr:MAG: Unknown protein [uncultured Thiotrichaceae bacterium]
MSESLYNLSIVRYTSDKPVEVLVRDLLDVMGKASDSYLEYKLSESLLFEESSSAILENVGQTEGERYQQLFLEHQVETKLYPALQLVAKEERESGVGEDYICPSCEHQQPKAAEDKDICEKCGISGQKYSQKIKKQQKRKDIYEAEKRKLEQSQTESLKVAQVRAEHEEAEELREDARSKLGMKKENRVIIALGSVVGVLAIAAIGYFVFEEINREPDQAAGLVAGVVNTDKNAVSTGTTATTEGVAGKKITTDQALQAIQTLTGNGSKAVAVSGNDALPELAEVEGASASSELAAIIKQVEKPPAELSSLQLEALTATLKSAGLNVFGYTESGQYKQLLPKLIRLLELDKPDLGVVFAESADDPYSRSLLILMIAQSEQQKNRSTHNDGILLAMKQVAVSTESEQLMPLLTAALSQAHAFTGDVASAEKLLDKAIEEAEKMADIPQQTVQWLTRMLIDHQHFNHLAGSEKLTSKLEALAESTDSVEEQLMASSIYTQLAAISVGSGDITDAASWLKNIPGKKNSQYLQAQLDDM